MRGVMRSLLEVFQTVAIAVIAVFFVRTFIAQPFLVSGASMEPTFQNGDYLLIDEISLRFREPVRGEVVVFRYPREPRAFYIKRIIGLPGERVTIKNGVVSVTNDDAVTVLREPYVVPGAAGAEVDVGLGSGEYYVLGDNRGFSFDSRSWGPLADGNIVGVVRMRLWPLSSALAFSPPSYEPATP